MKFWPSLQDRGVKPQHLLHPAYRPDIDGLRALAVLAVLGYHAFPEALPGGFTGVDIFFVISGFLISTILFGSFDRSDFSYAEFYARRIRRIFPALAAVLLAGMVFGWFVLLADEYRSLGKHTAAGAAFLSNFVLWKESGYFDTAAGTKPLLHLWSLGVEEQFYIVWPFLLGLVWKRRRNFLILTLLVAAASLALSLYLTPGHPVTAFYLPFTRFWELMAGSGLAYVRLYHPQYLKPFSEARAFAGLVLIVLGMALISSKSAFPGGWALLPVAGAFLVISAGNGTWFNRVLLGNRVMAGIGLISYPLYLWHWPLLSFAIILHDGAASPWLRGALLGLSFLLAWLTYTFIEIPLRFGPRRTSVIWLCSIIAVLGLAGSVAWGLNGLGSRPVAQNQIRLDKEFGKWAYKKNERCQKLVETTAITFCYTDSDAPKIMLLGDSHANQLYPGLEQALPPGTGLLSFGDGPPLDNVAISFENPTEHPWQKSLLSLQTAFRFLARAKSVQTVILAANFEPLIHGNFVLSEHKERVGKIFLHPQLAADASLSREALVERALARTIERLYALGKNVALVIDPPEPLLDIRSCLRGEKVKDPCAFPLQPDMERQQAFRDMLPRLQKRFPRLMVFDPVPYICGGGRCNMIRDEALVYRDLSHISEPTSLRVGAGLYKQLRAQGWVRAAPEMRD